jgi:2-polyprenyl-3-methyl-5-hydroxy-6-metoxy-1,4-benzoquinol methylase
MNDSARIEEASQDASINDAGHKNLACPYCKGASAHMFSSTDVNRGTTAEVFDYYQCSACGLIFMDPIPSDMSPFYTGGYDTIPDNFSQLKKLANVAKKDRYRIESILKYKQGGRLLEIGPWMGVFSCIAKEAGFAVTAIEMNQQCVNFLKDVVGVEAVQSCDPAATLDTLNEKFDVIALWHSLEHLPDPWRVVQKATQRLAPGGILYIAVPNVESYDFTVLREKWLHLDTPRHLYFYPAHSLEALCIASGLKTLELTTDDSLSKLLSRGVWFSRAASKVRFKYISKILGLLWEWSAARKHKGKYSGLTAIFVNPE